MKAPAIKNVLGNRLVIRRVPTSGKREPDYTDLFLPSGGPDTREPHFEALVLSVGEKLSEDIRPGQRVICGAHQSQSQVGTRKVLWQGEPAELMSVLDVVAIVEEC